VKTLCSPLCSSEEKSVLTPWEWMKLTVTICTFARCNRHSSNSNSSNPSSSNGALCRTIFFVELFF
jgi:hypothetical protein